MIQSDMNASEWKEQERWKRLLAWIQAKGFDASRLCVEPRRREGAGRGLFATRTLRPSKKPFLVIPAKALLNIRTLRSIYPSIALEGFPDSTSLDRPVLNGTQLLSIHLALFRPVGDSYSADPHFGPYIDSFPRDFDSHPLTWIVKEKLGKAELHETKLVQNLPPSVLKELQGVAKRFWRDWDVAVQAKENYLEELKSKNEVLFGLNDFLWGWLVVNSRSLYSDIFRRKLPLSNLTLCPIIDFANHTNSASLPCATWKDVPKDSHPRRGGELLRAHDYAFSPPEQGMNEGEEIFLKYGGHSNTMLFVEYGFVDENSDQQVDVSDLVDELVTKKPASRLIRQLLPEVAGEFMSDLKLYTTPSPSHPSWSLHCMLRVLNLEFGTSTDLSPGSVEVENILKPWRDVTLGKADIVSDTNETFVRNDLESICNTIIVRSPEGIQLLEDKELEELANECDWYEWAKGCLVKLWKEEAQVDWSVMDSLASGQTF